MKKSRNGELAKVMFLIVLTGKNKGCVGRGEAEHINFTKCIVGVFTFRVLNCLSSWPLVSLHTFI